MNNDELNKVNYFIQNFEYEQALILLEKILNFDSEDTLAWNEKGNVLHKMKKYEEALQSYEKALIFDPEYVSAWNGKGTVFCSMERYEDALKSFEKSLTLDHEDASSWYSKGGVLYDMKKYNEALDSYEKALTIDPKNAGVWTNAGNSFGQMENYEDALKSFEKALTLDPEFVGALSSKGFFFYKIKNYEDSLKSFEKALTLDPDCVGVWFAKGNVFCEMKKYEEALKSFEKALTIDPENANLWYSKGLVFYWMKKYEAALKSFEKALTLDPENINAWLGKGEVLSDIKKYEEALRSFEKALKLDPEFVSAWNSKGFVFFELDNSDELLRCLMKLESLNGLQNNIGFWVKVLDEYDLPYMTRRFIGKYELDEYVSWKRLIAAVHEKCSVTDTFLDFLNSSRIKADSGYMYWLSSGIIYYYMGDPITTFGMLDDNESSDYADSFLWHYYLYKSAFSFYHADAESILKYAIARATQGLEHGFFDVTNAFFAGLLFLEAGNDGMAFHCFTQSRSFLPSRYMLLLPRFDQGFVTDKERILLVEDIVEEEKRCQQNGGGFLYPINELYLQVNCEKSFEAIVKYAIYHEIEEAVSELICLLRELEAKDQLDKNKQRGEETPKPQDGELIQDIQLEWKESWRFVLHTPEPLKVYEAWKILDDDKLVMRQVFDEKVNKQLEQVKDTLALKINDFSRLFDDADLESKISRMIFKRDYPVEVVNMLINFCFAKKRVDAKTRILLLFYMAIKIQKGHELSHSMLKAAFVAAIGAIPMLFPNCPGKEAMPIVLSPIAEFLFSALLMKYLKKEKDVLLSELTYEAYKSDFLNYLLDLKESDPESYDEIAL
jgi:tetratricopeptide (TPR) repeat protein